MSRNTDIMDIRGMLCGVEGALREMQNVDTDGIGAEIYGEHQELCDEIDDYGVQLRRDLDKLRIKLDSLYKAVRES